jgi:hypothetical protein
MTTNYKFIIRFRNNCKNFNLIKKNQKIRILKYCDVFETILPFNKYEDYIKKLSSGVSKAQTGVPYEIRYGDRSEEIKKKKSDWTKENFHKTGLGQMNFEGENNPMYGRSMYDVWEEKYGKDEADRKLVEWKEKKSGKTPWNTNNKKIVQLDNEGNEIKVWNGLHEINKETGWSKPNIIKVIRGERNFANGFRWKELN